MLDSGIPGVPDDVAGSSSGAATNGNAGTNAMPQPTGNGGSTPSPIGPAAGTSNAESGGSAGGEGGSAGSAGSGGAAGSAGSGSAAGSAGQGACADCAALKAALVHRYDFEGTGPAVMDRVGSAHGTIQAGGTLGKVDGKGAVTLGGGTAGAYVDLPNGILSSLTAATLESWVSWSGGDAWQRIFDFGDTTNATPEDNPANGKSYLFLTPATDSASGGTMRAVFSLSGGSAAAETRLEAPAAMSQSLAQVVVVVDPAQSLLLLYQDGAKLGQQAFTGALSDINDVNAWLGRSQYQADPELSGIFHDFRIYDEALTAAQIATSFKAGPDPAFLAE